MKHNYALQLLLVILMGLFAPPLMAQDDPAYPFPMNLGYSYGVLPENASSADAMAAYEYWKETYVTSWGACEGQRVIFDYYSGTDRGAEDKTRTVSEGIGYGMLLAAYAGDRQTFDGLWTYYQNNTNERGVMNWMIEYDKNGSRCSTVDYNGASDAELDAAMALIVASYQWQSDRYMDDAKMMIRIIREHEFDGLILKPGDAFGGASITNPSYFSPQYYRVFSTLDPGYEQWWLDAAAEGYRIIELAGGSTGLVPDWCDANGQPSAEAAQYEGGGRDFIFDGIRTPLRSGIDYLWHGNEDALAYCEKISSFVRNTHSDPGTIGNKYGTQYSIDMSEGQYRQGKNNTFLGCFGVAQMATDATTDAARQDYVNKIYSENANHNPQEGFYFNATLKVLTLFIETGNFWLPPPDDCDAPELGEERSLCEGNGSITLDAQVTDRDFVWRRNGIELAAATQTLEVTQSGNYEVIATDPSGCVRRDKVYVADSELNADFTYTNMAGNIILESSQTVGVTSYSWEYDGGVIGDGPTAEFAPPNPVGSFDVTLTIGNEGYGCTGTSTITKTIILGEGEGVAYHDFNGDDVIVWANEGGFEPLPKIHCSREAYDDKEEPVCPGNPCSLVEATSLGTKLNAEGEAINTYTYIGVDFKNPADGTPNAIDIEATPYVRFRIKSTEDVDLTVGLKDASNLASTTPGGYVSLVAGEWTEITLDYTDNMEGYGEEGLEPVDFTAIQGMQFNALEKTPDYKGTISIDWLIVGQATIPAPAFDIKRDEMGFPVYEDPDGDEVYTKVPNWKRQINACEGKATLTATSCTASSIEWYSGGVLLGKGSEIEVGPGKYYVHLKNSTGTTIDSVTVTGANVVPKFDYDYEDSGLSVRLYNSSLDYDTFEWDYGVIPSDPDATTWEEGYNYYNQEGTYEVCLSVTNEACAITKEYCEDIEIICNAPLDPVSGLTSTPNAIVDDTVNTCSATELEISIDAQDNASSYGWYGMRTTPISSKATMSGAFEESQWLKIEAYNVCGEKVKDSVYIKVIPSAVASFTVDQYDPASYIFTAEQVGENATYSWFEGETLLGSGYELDYTFAQAGDHEVTLVVENDCGTDEETKSLGCPKPNIANATIAGKSSICEGGDCAAYQVSGITNAESYVWSGPGVDDVCSQSGVDASINPSTTGDITVVAVNACGESEPIAFPVSVKPVPTKPVIVGNTNPSCEDTRVIYEVETPNANSTYEWTVPSDASFSGNGNSSISVNFGTSNGKITVTETRNGCSSETQELDITLSGCGLSANFEADVESVCEDVETVTFTDLSTGTTDNTVYEWNFGSGATPATADTKGPHQVTYSGAGVRSVSLTITDGATSEHLEPNYITVNPLPGTAGTITGPTSVCANETRTFFVGNVSNATSYEWTAPEGSVVDGSGTSVKITFGSVSGPVTVTPVNECGDGVASSIDVSVAEAPTTSAIVGSETPGCNSRGNVYSVDANTDATYEWTVPEGAVITAGAGSNEITVRFATANGEISVIETNANNCAGEVVTIPITLTGCDLAADFKASSTTVCEAEMVTFTNLTTGASANATYFWEFGTGASAQTREGAGPHQIRYTGAGSKTVKLTVTDGAAVSAQKSLTVNPLPAAAGTIEGPATVCQGETHTYKIATVSNALSYEWSVPADAEYTGTGTSITVTFGEVSGTVSVTPVNDCGDGESSSVDVDISPAPVTGPIDGNSSPECNGTETYTVSGAAGSTFEWTVPDNATIVGDATGSSISVDFGASNGDITVQETNSNGCKGELKTMTINLSGCGLAPSFKASASTVCQDATVTYTDLSTGTTSQTVYEWDFGTDATPQTITGKGPHKVTYSSEGPKTVSLTVIDGTRSLSTDIQAVTVNPKPGDAGAISGTDLVCPGTNGVAYSIDAVDGANSYTWSVPGDASSAGTGTSIEVNFGASSGMVTVTPKNACGNGGSSSFDVTVSPEVNTSAIAGETNLVCEQQGVTYSVTGGANSTYNWSVPSGAEIVGPTNTNEIEVNFGSYDGTITVVETSEAGCRGTMKRLNVKLNGCNLNAQFEASSQTTCTGTAITFTNKSTTSEGAEFAWNFGTAASPQTAVGPGPHTVEYESTGSYNVSLTVTEGPAADTELKEEYITITELPGAVSTVSGPASVCSGSTVRYAIDPVAGISNYEWTVPDGATVSGTGTSVDVTFGSQGGTVSVAAKNGCGLGTPGTVDVEVTESVSPEVTLVASDNEVYTGNPVRYTANVTSGGDDPYFRWFVNGDYVSGGTEREVYEHIYDIEGEQEVYVEIESSNACADPANVTSNTAIVNVITPVDGYAYAGLDQETCGNMIKLAGNDPTCNGTGTWSFVEGGGMFMAGANTYNTSVYNLQPGDNVLEWKVESTCGVYRDTVVITVYSPAVSIAASEQTICEGTNVTFTASPVNEGPTPSYTWLLNGVDQGINAATFSSDGLADLDEVKCIMASSLCENEDATSNTIFMSVDPRPDIADAGSEDVIYTTSTTGQLEAVPYAVGTGEWSTIGGATIDNSLNRTTEVSGLINGDNVFTWTISSGVCPESSDNITISVGSKPSTKTIQGPDNVDANTTVTYYVPETPGNEYNWTVPDGARIETGDGTNSITVSFGNNVEGSVTLEETNNFGSTKSYKSVNSVDAGSKPSTQSIQGPSRFEIGEIVEYSIAGLPGSEFVWSLPPGGTFMSGEGTSTIRVRFDREVNGTISVTEKGEFGEAVSEKSVTTSDKPVSEQITGPMVVSPNQTYTYSIPYHEGSNYSWTVPEGARIESGHGTNQIVVTYGANTDGEVTVRETNENGDSADSKLPIIGSTVGTKDANMASYKLFPNPTNKFTTLRVSSMNSSYIDIKVVDIKGYPVIETKASTNQDIRLGDELNAGVYTIQINHGDSIEHLKFIKVD